MLFSTLPPGFPELLKAWFERSLDEDIAECTATFRRLDTFGFIHHFQMLIGRVAYGAIEKKIQDHFSRMWKEACLKEILQWASNDLTKWADAVFPPRKLISLYKLRIEYRVQLTSPTRALHPQLPTLGRPWHELLIIMSTRFCAI